MGRHRKPSSRFLRRGSVIALGAFVPVGYTAVAGAPEAGVVFRAADPLPPEEPVAVPVAGPTPVQLAPVVEWETHRAVRPAPAPPVLPDPVPVETDSPVSARHPAAAEVGTPGVPGIAVAAYTNAERILAERNPACELPWTLLAGIGRIESGHAFGGNADEAGDPLTPIYGPTLDGSLDGNAVIADSDSGELDGNAAYDRAVGPMQFLPETWWQYGADGNGDGIMDPQNLYDAALAAGRYLCSGGLSMIDPDQRTRAILRYNYSAAYVANVLAWENAYRSGVTPDPGELPAI
ncbi:lytic murein transglycosylase [Nocardia sp. NPDC127579]|uniref:lytic transglycosylase domain-containing protein n=1 Tax=Nocardia sp. NPDC127579 TaxID=3345402 RepID=UPI00363986BF